MLHGATVRREFHPETNGVKACPHRHKRVLSHGAPADPSDPWNSHAAPVSPRQNGDSDSVSTTASGFIFQTFGHWAGFLSLATAALVAAAFLWAAMPETRPAKYLD